MDPDKSCWGRYDLKKDGLSGRCNRMPVPPGTYCLEHGCVVCGQGPAYFPQPDPLVAWKNGSFAHIGCAADEEYAMVEDQRDREAF